MTDGVLVIGRLRKQRLESTLRNLRLDAEMTHQSVLVLEVARPTFNGIAFFLDLLQPAPFSLDLLSLGASLTLLFCFPRLE